MEYAFNPVTTPSLPIIGSSLGFPIHRVFCVGKNYAKHVEEMGGNIKTSSPVIFTKYADTIMQDHSDIAYPPNTQNLHYEVELVVAMGPNGIFGYGVGIDLTRRDLQSEARARGGPWDRAKNFPQSAPCSALTPANDVNLDKAAIYLEKNGQRVQSSSLDKMIWPIEEIITHLDHDMNLRAGDLIFTGTPEGVGTVTHGDRLLGRVTGLAPINVQCV